MPENKLFEHYGLTVDIENTAAPDVLKFLDENEYGTPGGIIYQHTQASEKAKMLPDSHFFTLRKNKKLLGNIAFVKRHLVNSNISTNAYYIRYLTVMPSYRRNINIVKNDKDQKIPTNRGQGIIKESMKDFFSNAEKYLTNEKNDSKCIFYAHIEEDNQRSFLLSESFGYEKTGRIETNIFSRLFPKKDSRLEKIKPEDKGMVKSMINEFYHDYSMYTVQNLFYNDNYYIFRNKNKEIIAGVQANLITWRIKHMPGISGKILLKILPFVPFFSRLFNPDSFRFLTFESIFVKKGYEKDLNKLFEAVCAQFKVPVALFWTDINGPLNQLITKHVSSGIFQKISKTMTAGIYVKFINFTEDEKVEFISKPAYVSAFDLT